MGKKKKNWELRRQKYFIKLSCHGSTELDLETLFARPRKILDKN
jgi:hypothetical protein